LAIKNGHLDIIKLLLTKTEIDFNDYKPFTDAAHSNNPEMVRFVYSIVPKDKLDYVIKSNSSALLTAYNKQNVEVFKELLKIGIKDEYIFNKIKSDKNEDFLKLIQ
jgi:ankyrin repeat protein